MFLEDENPTIRQTIFILNSQLSYQFDVNQTIQIHQLKKMIAAAAHLRKNSFSLYSEGIDYTFNDEDRLMTLFPGQQVVKFNLLKGEPDDLDQSMVKIRMDQYCPKHELKYLSYYCYTCHKSVCSVCVHDKEHQGHNYREKYDYLQNSKYLVDAAFKKDMSFNVDPKNSYQVTNDLTVLKTNIKNVMFSKLFEMLGKVEERLENLVDKYNSINKTSCNNLQDNTILIKKYCTKGLDELKESIGITDIIIDEDVFLTFDKKYNELYNIQSRRFSTDVNKFKELNNTMVKPIQDLVDKTYMDIFNLLSDKLKSKEIDNMLSKIEDKLIKPITEQEVIEQIVNEEKTPKPYLNFSKEVSQAIKNVSKKEINSPKEPTYTNIQQSNQGMVYKPVLDNPFLNPNPSPKPNPSPTVNPFLINNNPLTTQGPTNPNNPFMNPQVPANSFMPLYSNTPTPNDDVVMSQAPTTIIKPLESVPYIMAQVKSTNNVKILDKKGITTKVVNFPLILGTNSFFIYSTHCNLNGFLYVSGGVEIVGSSVSSSTMFKYNYENNTIVRLANMNFPRHNHTMISNGSFIYAVGGLTNTVERYDTRFNIWSVLPTMTTERQFPILFIHQNYLYAFFGKNSKGEYLETIERLNINHPTMWEIVTYKNPEKVNVKIYGCAVSEVEGSLFFFSGVKEDKPVDSIFTYDFEQNTILGNEQTVDWKEYFEENVLYQVGEYFGQIAEKTYNSISLQLTS